MTTPAAVLMLAGLVPVLLAALGSYAVAKRSSSGKVATTEAETLWAESQAMRVELRNEVAALRSENMELRAEIRGLRAEIVVLRQQVNDV